MINEYQDFHPDIVHTLKYGRKKDLVHSKVLANKSFSKSTNANWTKAKGVILSEAAHSFSPDAAISRHCLVRKLKTGTT